VSTTRCPPGDWVVTSVVRNPNLQLQPRLILGRRSSRCEGEESQRVRTIRWVLSGLGSTYRTTGYTARLNRGRSAISQSHGCVRMTNWDATRVAALVKAGTASRVRGMSSEAPGAQGSPIAAAVLDGFPRRRDCYFPRFTRVYQDRIRVKGPSPCHHSFSGPSSVDFKMQVCGARASASPRRAHKKR
jgi:hypothetical protein